MLCGFGFVVVLCVFCFVCFVCGLVFDRTAHWTVYRSITIALLRLLTFRRHCMIDNLQFIFLLRLNASNDLARAMKALDGKGS